MLIDHRRQGRWGRMSLFARWLAGIVADLTATAETIKPVYVETSTETRARLQSDLLTIDRWLMAAEPGTERWRQLAAERRRIMVALGPQ